MTEDPKGLTILDAPGHYSADQASAWIAGVRLAISEATQASEPSEDIPRFSGEVNTPMKKPTKVGLSCSGINAITMSLDGRSDCSAQAIERAIEWVRNNYQDCNIAALCDGMRRAYSATPAPATQEPSAPQQTAEVALTGEDLVVSFEMCVNRVAQLHSEYMGKAMPDRIYDVFATLRDDKIPAYRKQLIAALARQAGTADEAVPSAAKPVRVKWENHPEVILRAMPQNYGMGHQWDALDAAACTRAADDLERLRAAQAVQPEALTDEDAKAQIEHLDRTNHQLRQGLHRIVHELRTYNPAADEYKGAHIHKVWARELEAIASHPTGKGAKP
jgi:hypothetical protein